MTRIACDSTTLAHDPQAVDVAFFYANGLYTQKQPDVAAKFPGKVTLGIDVLGSAPSAAARDWETGDKSGSLEQWVGDHNELAKVKDACIYCNRSTIAEVRDLTGSMVLGRDYILWVSTLDGTLYTAPGVGLCQVVTTGPNGETYDLTVIYDDAWHPSPSPVAHIRANLMEEVRAAMGALAGLAANATRLPG